MLGQECTLRQRLAARVHSGHIVCTVQGKENSAQCAVNSEQ